MIALRQERGISRKELAQRLDIPYTTLRNYENDQREPGHRLLIRLAEIFQVSVDYLIGCPRDGLPEEAMEVARDYAALSDHGKGAVRAILRYEAAAAGEGAAEEPERRGVVSFPRIRRSKSGITELEVYDQTAAAGLGNYLDTPAHHTEQYPDGVIPSKADFGVVISGNSMEPRIHDGGTVFVQAAPRIEPGQIGVFVLNGQAFCKKLAVDRDSRQIRLVSLNPDYGDILVGGGDELRTLGRVLGQWTPGFDNDDLFGW